MHLAMGSTGSYIPATVLVHETVVDRREPCEQTVYSDVGGKSQSKDNFSCRREFMNSRQGGVFFIKGEQSVLVIR